MQSDRVRQIGIGEGLPWRSGVAARGDGHVVDGRGGFGPEGEAGLVLGGVFGVHEDEYEVAGCGVDAAAVGSGPVLGEGEGEGEEKGGGE